MNSNPKIMVFKLKELIYTAVFVVLGLILILLLIYMFFHSEEESVSSSATYIPGTYSSALTIGSIPIELSVKVDSERIVDVSLSPLSETVETMYPLMQSSVDTIREQILSSQNPDDIYISSDSQYTDAALIETIKTALNKAKIN